MKCHNRTAPSILSLLILIAVLVSSALVVSPVAAAIITVTTFDDVVNPEQCSLRDAINSANADTAVNRCAAGTIGTDTIVLEAGTYTLNGQLPLIESEIIIRGEGSESTIIQASDCDPTDDDNKCTQTDRILYINAGPGSAGTGDLALEGVTLRHGNPHEEIGGGIAYDYGGAIYNKGWLTLIDTVIESNRAAQGGGIYNNSFFNEGVRISASTIQNNRAEGDGGGIYNLSGGITLGGSRIWNNYSGGFGGGAQNFSILNLVESDVTGNISKYSGGGIYNTTDSISSGSVDIEDSTITDNATETGHGGGIGNDSQLTISGSEVSGNTVGELYYGGGIDNTLEATLDISTSLISENIATMGGGVYNASSAGDGVQITNSTLSDNLAVYGGGIYNTTTGTIVLGGVTVSGNKVDDGGGGGIYNAYRLVAVNSTFSGNKAAMGGGIYNYRAGTHLTNCTIYGNTGTGVFNSLGNLEIYNTLMVASTLDDCSSYHGASGDEGEVIGHHNLVARNAEGYECYLPDYLFDPLVDDLADNGGPTLTHALQEGSPAIDAGDADICAAPPVNNLDQRGVVRPQGEGCDIGAFEREQGAFIFLPLIVK